MKRALAKVGAFLERAISSGSFHVITSSEESACWDLGVSIRGQRFLFLMPVVFMWTKERQRVGEENVTTTAAVEALDPADVPSFEVECVRRGSRRSFAEANTTHRDDVTVVDTCQTEISSIRSCPEA